MSMHDISDKELDKLFSHSAEEPNIPFDENAWSQLEHSLNKHDQKNRRKRYRNAALVALAIYFLSTVSVRTPEYSTESHGSSYVSSSEKINEKKEEVSYTTPELNNNEALANKQQNQSQPATYTNTNSAVKSREAAPTHRMEKQKTASYDKSIPKIHASKNQHEESLLAIAQQRGNERPSEITSYAASSIEKTTNSDSSSPLSDQTIDSRATQRSLALSSATTNNDRADDSVHADKSTLSPPTNDPGVTGDNKQLALAADSADLIIPADSLLPVAKASEKDSVKPKENKPLKRHVSFGLFASPDYSLTSSAQWVSPGAAVGIFAEYHINHRLTIFAGIMKSSKIYSSNGNDYTATDRYWAYKGYTSRIDGSCTVLDVPINIKYHFYNRNKNLLFASGGVSSYFMLHEEYRFVYSNPYYTDRSWSYNNKRNYLFGIVNLSVGYERYLSKSFSVQLEPFVKIPLGTIGDGQVKLLTTGMFFYLKYSIH